MMIRAHHLQGRAIVAIDESGFAHDMASYAPYAPRTHGYAWGYVWLCPCWSKMLWETRLAWGEGGPIIGALIGKALLTVGLFKTNVTADVFTPQMFLPPRCFYPPDVFTPQMFLPHESNRI